MSQNLNSAVAVIGIDIGKNSFHVVGLDDRGAIALRQKWSRGQIEARLANLPPCLIGMESLRWCASSQSEAEVIGSRRSADASEVCTAVLKGAEERLPRRRGDRRGGPAPDHEVCGNEDCRPARPAGTVSRARARSVNAPASSIKFAPSCWSGAWPFDRGCGSCALSCRASWLHRPTCCRLAWCGSSGIWPKTGADSMSGSIRYPVRLPSWLGRTLDASD